MDSIEPMQVDDPEGPPDAPAGFTVEPPSSFVSMYASVLIRMGMMNYEQTSLMFTL